MGAGRRARSISGTSARLVGVERAGLIRSWGGCLKPQLDTARQRLLTSGATLPVGGRVPTIGGGRGAGPHGLHCAYEVGVGSEVGRASCRGRGERSGKNPVVAV